VIFKLAFLATEYHCSHRNMGCRITATGFLYQIHCNSGMTTHYRTEVKFDWVDKVPPQRVHKPELPQIQTAFNAPSQVVTYVQMISLYVNHIQTEMQITTTQDSPSTCDMITRLHLWVTWYYSRRDKKHSN